MVDKLVVFVKPTKRETIDLSFLYFSLREMRKPTCVGEKTDMNTARISLSESENSMIKGIKTAW